MSVEHPPGLEKILFTEEEIPWDDIAFEVIRRTLTDFFEDRRTSSTDPEAAYGFEVKDLVFKPAKVIS